MVLPLVEIANILDGLSATATHCISAIAGIHAPVHKKTDTLKH